jgi:hypothetical protein
MRLGRSAESANRDESASSISVVTVPYDLSILIPVDLGDFNRLLAKPVRVTSLAPLG